MQVLFFEQDRGTTAPVSKLPSPKQAPTRENTPSAHNHHSLMKRLNLDSDQQSVKTDDTRRTAPPDKRKSQTLDLEPSDHVNVKGTSQIQPRKEREILEEGVSGSKLDPRIQRTRQGAQL